MREGEERWKDREEAEETKIRRRENVKREK